MNQSHAAECTVTVFGRPLKDMEARNADYMRGAIDPEKLDFCHACMEWRKRSAARWFDIGANSVHFARVCANVHYARKN